MIPENSRLKFATDVARKLDCKMGGGNANTFLSQQRSESHRESKRFFPSERKSCIVVSSEFLESVPGTSGFPEQTFDPLSVLSALLAAGELVVHKAEVLPVAWSAT